MLGVEQPSGHRGGWLRSVCRELWGSTIGEYTTSGTPVNTALISGLGSPQGLAVIPTAVPAAESGSLTLLSLALAGLGIREWRKRAGRFNRVTVPPSST